MFGWQLWVILALVLFVLEIFTPGFFVMSIGLGALVSAFAAALGFGIVMQLLLLAGGSLASVFLLRPLLLRQTLDGKKTGVDALVSKEGLVTEPISNLRNAGRIRIGGESWKARSTDGTRIGKERVVVVDRIDGATAYVHAKEEGQS
jgi:membrane protein implicated in regulation of membrane protease activity